MLMPILQILLFVNIAWSQPDTGIKLSREHLARLLKLQEQDLRSIDLRGYSTEKRTLLTYGVPKSARAMDPKGMTFRHYVGSGMEKILSCNCLKAGFTPYIILSPGLGREIFENLYGVFLTSTDAKPYEVGLPANNNYDYIDFELDDQTGLLWLEPKIFLIPGFGDIPEWLKPKYQKYKKSGVCEPALCDTFYRIDQRGGGNPLFIPIKIKCVKRNETLQCL